MIRAMAIMLCLVTASCVTAELTDNSTDPVMAQETAWTEALLANDMDAVDALMHPNFRLIRAYAEGAPAIDKAAYIGTPGMSANSIEITSVDIEIIEKVAIAKLAMTLDWQREGVGKLPPHFDLTDTWLLGEDGTWRILSRVSQLAAGPDEATE